MKNKIYNDGLRDFRLIALVGGAVMTVSKILLTSFQTSGRQILHIALSAFLVIPVLVHSTVGRTSLEEVSFRQVVTTPSGTALGGAVDLTLRSDGTYKAHFHMHDSGAIDYDFVVRAVFGASNGTAFALQHSGHVEGTESTTLTRGPRRNSDKDVTGFHQLIRDNWLAVKAGKMSVSKDYSKAGVVGFIEDLSKTIVEITGGAARGAAGAVIALGDEMAKTFESLEQSGTIGVIAGVAVIASGGSAVMAVTTGVKAGLVTKALIKNRPLTADEYNFANEVFKNTLPPAQDIILTNLEGLGGRAFVMPGVGSKIYVNIGAYGYDRPMTHLRSKDDNPGRLFIHELTHVWQIHHKKFVPGWVCAGLIAQAGNTFGDAYDYRSKGFLPWTEFNIEEQSSLVEEWFGERQTRAASGMTPEDPNNPYFRYIRDNIRGGKTAVASMSEDSVGGMLQRGQFRTRVQIDSMSLEDRRNTLISELANRTKDAVSYYQSLNDTNLAGAGALLVFLREGRRRTDQELKTMSANDMRNTVIVDVNARMGRSIRDLQALSNMDVAKVVWSAVAPVQAFQGGWQTVTNQNGHYTLILQIIPGPNPVLYDTNVTGQFINTDGATKYNGYLQGIIPRGTRTLIYNYTQPEIKAGGNGQFTLSNDGNAITGSGTAGGATFTWNGTRAK